MELRGIRLKGEQDELRVSTGRVMNAYPDRRRKPIKDPQTAQRTRPRRDTPKAVIEIDPAERWVVSGFLLISTPEARRWSGSSDLWFESDGLRFHVVSLEPWKAGSLSNPAGFETWNFRALCAPEAHQIEHLPASRTRKSQAEADDSAQ
jgi:hypothetical protein